MILRSAGTAAAFAILAFAASGASAQQLPSDTAHSVDGRLETTDPASDESHYDDYRIRLGANQRMRFSVDSDDIDPIVRIYRADDMHEPVAENDDYGESLNARLDFAAVEGGDYVVRVISYDSGETGPYRLRTQPLAPLPPPVTTPTGTATTSWRVFDGRLAEGGGADDAGDDDGSPFNDFQIRMAAGDFVMIRLDSEAFDPMVQILTAEGRSGPELATDDDSGPGLNSALIFEAPQSGDYIIRVSAFDGEGGGAYRLRIGD